MFHLSMRATCYEIIIEGYFKSFPTLLHVKFQNYSGLMITGMSYSFFLVKLMLAVGIEYLRGMIYLYINCSAISVRLIFLSHLRRTKKFGSRLRLKMSKFSFNTERTLNKIKKKVMEFSKLKCDIKWLHNIQFI
jgi:hypothetical protein